VAVRSVRQIGLLASASPYSPRLPMLRPAEHSGIVRVSSAVTVAGQLPSSPSANRGGDSQRVEPQRTFTVFPAYLPIACSSVVSYVFHNIYHVPSRMSRTPDARVRLIVDRHPRCNALERAEMCFDCARAATEDISFLESRIDASASSLLVWPCSGGRLAPEFSSADFPQRPVRASSERWTGTGESVPAGRRKGVIGRRKSSAVFAT